MSLSSIDSLVLALITPLAIAFLIGGLDDLAVDLAWIATVFPRIRNRPHPNAPPLPVAILVPLWKEHAVITRMLEHNLAAIRYPNYHFFAGVYANDAETEDAVAAVSERHPNVHLAICLARQNRVKEALPYFETALRLEGVQDSWIAEVVKLKGEKLSPPLPCSSLPTVRSPETRKTSSQYSCTKGFVV